MAVQGTSRVKASDAADYGVAVLEAPHSFPDGAQPLVSPPAEDFSSVLLLDSIRQSLIRQVSVASLSTAYVIRLVSSFLESLGR